MDYELVIRGGTLVGPKGTTRGDIAIREGRIAALGQDLRGKREICADGMLVFPGVIDVHTHMAARAGSATSVDDFESGTRAAAAGGVTTIIDFTTASEGHTLREDIRARVRAAEPALVDVALHAEVIHWRPGREEEIQEAVEDGVTSFKFYTAYGSLGERSDTGALYHAFRAIADAGGVAQVHAEDDPLIDSMLARLDDDAKTSMTGLPRSRPSVAEGLAITEVVYLAEILGVRLHICHISSALGVEALAQARSRGIAVTGETCPQYLLLSEAVYEGEFAEQYSVMPPLRTSGDQAALWGAIQEGVISCVATDHCPFRRSQKVLRSTFSELPYGLPGVETLLPLLYSEGVARGRIGLTDLVSLLSESPARIFGLSHVKGSLTPGWDADVVVFDPAQEWTVTADALQMATDFSPYEGRRVRGKVKATVARGEIVYQEGRFTAEPGRGAFVRCLATSP